jgi:hypothetical protein
MKVRPTEITVTFRYNAKTETGAGPLWYAAEIAKFVMQNYRLEFAGATTKSGPEVEEPE